VDAELRLEGMARELVNRIQRLRREAGLEVTDRIRLAVGGDAEVVEAAKRHEAFIAGETLATAYAADADWTEAGYTVVRTFEVDGSEARIGLSKS